MRSRPRLRDAGRDRLRSRSSPRPQSLPLATRCFPNSQLWLRSINLFHTSQSIDLLKRLVPPNPHNPRKTQCKAARMALRAHDIVERNLEHQHRLDAPHISEVLDRMVHEKLRELGDLR